MSDDNDTMKDCARCNRTISLRDGNEWSETDTLNVCDDCARWMLEDYHQRLATAEKERDQAKRVAKLACDDWGYEKVETEKLLAPIIGQEFIDGDSFGVPTLADTVEEAIRQLQGRAMTPAVEALVCVVMSPGPWVNNAKLGRAIRAVQAERTGSDAGESKRDEREKALRQLDGLRRAGAMPSDTNPVINRIEALSCEIYSAEMK